MPSPSGATSDPTLGQTGRPQVLLVGGGFGGIGTARNLKRAAVDVTSVDKNDYHTLQPLLYQVATDLLEAAACASSSTRCTARGEDPTEPPCQRPLTRSRDGGWLPPGHASSSASPSACSPGRLVKSMRR